MNVVKLIHDLRRRRVFRAMGYYLIGAWLVLQVADVISEPAGLPAWTLTALLYVAFVGFPIAVYLGWRYQLGEHGLVRTLPPESSDVANLPLRASDYSLIVVFVVIASIVGWQFIAQVIQDAEESVTIGSDMVVRQNSIAVLPFQDHSVNSNHNYMADGVSDTVTHVLGQVEGLIVTARTSSQVFKERTANILDVARELRVAHVLEGSVQRSGDTVRITAALIEAAGGTELWSQQFNRDVNDIFEIQDEIAIEVVNALSEVLQLDNSEVKPEYRPDLKAYEQVVLGKQQLARHTVEGYMNAFERFGEAISIDPDYSLAYVYQARALGRRQDLSPDETNKLRWQLVDKALELDPLSADALVELSLAQRFDNEADKVALTLQRAIELNPSLVEARTAYSQWLFLEGDKDGSLEQARVAAELDPRNASVMMSLAMAYWNVAQAEAAIDILKDLLRQDPAYPHSYRGLTRWYMQLGKPGEAMRYTKALYDLDPENPVRQKELCDMHDQLWDHETALACYEAYLERFPDDLDVRKNMLWFRDGPEAAEPLFRQQIEEEPWSDYRKVQYANFLSWERRHEELVPIVEAAFPQLISDSPQINDWTSWPGRLLALAYIETGEKEKGLKLLSQIEQAVTRMRKLQGTGWVSGIEDAQALAIRGEKDRALDAFEAAVDAGWMFYSLHVENDPSFDAFKDDERFLGIVQKLADHLADELQYYEEHKDEPLF